MVSVSLSMQELLATGITILMQPEDLLRLDISAAQQNQEQLNT